MRNLSDIISRDLLPSVRKPGQYLGLETNARHADFTAAERLQFEKELLGFYISGHPMNTYTGLAEALSTHTEEQVLAEGDRMEFRMCRLLIRVFTRTCSGLKAKAFC